jgi:undecaprenyl diphosphate synthase
VANKSATQIDRIPVHLAIVPDGNGRWAQRRGLPRLAGHQAGADNMLRLIECVSEYPVKFLTLYGFSTENWKRPRAEVNGLFDMLAGFIDKNAGHVHSQNIRLCHIGRSAQLPERLKGAMDRASELTRHNTGLTLLVAFDYGGRAEIVDAFRAMANEGIRPEDINESTVEDHLYTAGVPPVDLLIRTGNEMRFSNFLIWQTAYSEYYLSDVLWPDFGKGDVEKALLSYSQRKRRFGGL